MHIEPLKFKNKLNAAARFKFHIIDKDDEYIPTPEVSIVKLPEEW